MPYSKEQLRTYWQTHKEQLNQKRRQKRRLAKIVRLATEKVSHFLTGADYAQEVKVSPNQVSHSEVSQKTANPNQVSHAQSKNGKPENGKPIPPPAKPNHLARLIHRYQTQTNYVCSLTCSQNKYCSNC